MYQKRNGLDVLALFLGDYSRQLYLREISQKAKIPLKTTQTFLAKLEKGKILKSTVSGKNKYFRLNLDNIQTKLMLQQAESQQTSRFLEKYPELKTFLKSAKTDNTLIVFGSFAKFTAKKDSDLDLLIIAKQSEEIPSHLLPYKIHRVEMTEKTFIKAVQDQETLIKEIEENHIILNNHSFYINTMWDHHGKRQA
ncbi:MAG: nucleotidyltransferase domain-containing protein [Nanoarchaeota archaeon]|nr:nucleotidyltransferase domain-containing protein [Nanoarchaeota archaeon]